MESQWFSKNVQLIRNNLKLRNFGSLTFDALSLYETFKTALFWKSYIWCLKLKLWSWMFSPLSFHIFFSLNLNHPYFSLWIMAILKEVLNVVKVLLWNFFGLRVFSYVVNAFKSWFLIILIEYTWRFSWLQSCSKCFAWYSIVLFMFSFTYSMAKAFLLGLFVVLGSLAIGEGQKNGAMEQILKANLNPGER